MERTGLKETFIRQFIEQNLSVKMGSLLESAGYKGVIPFEYVKTQAKERFLEEKRSMERGGSTEKAWRFALASFCRRLIPRYLTGLVGPGYFNRMIE